MKKCLGVFLILAFVVGCENESKLTFDTLQLVGENCTDCPTIEIPLEYIIDRKQQARLTTNIGTVVANEECGINQSVHHY